MTDQELVHVAVAASVATITLDSPDNRNALSSGLLADLNAGPRHRPSRPPQTGRRGRSC